MHWQGEFDSLRRTVHGQQRLIEQQGQHIEAQQRRLETLESWPGYTPSRSQEDGNLAGYDCGFVIAGLGGDFDTRGAKFRTKIGSCPPSNSCSYQQHQLGALSC